MRTSNASPSGRPRHAPDPRRGSNSLSQRNIMMSPALNACGACVSNSRRCASWPGRFQDFAPSISRTANGPQGRLRAAGCPLSGNARHHRGSAHASGRPDAPPVRGPLPLGRQSDGMPLAGDANPERAERCTAWRRDCHRGRRLQLPVPRAPRRLVRAASVRRPLERAAGGPDRVRRTQFQQIPQCPLGQPFLVYLVVPGLLPRVRQPPHGEAQSDRLVRQLGGSQSPNYPWFSSVEGPVASTASSPSAAASIVVPYITHKLRVEADPEAQCSLG